MSMDMKREGRAGAPGAAAAEPRPACKPPPAQSTSIVAGGGGATAPLPPHPAWAELQERRPPAWARDFGRLPSGVSKSKQFTLAPPRAVKSFPGSTPIWDNCKDGVEIGPELACQSSPDQKQRYELLSTLLPPAIY